MDEYARAIVETVRAPLLVLDDELTILTANPAFLQEYELDAEGVVGHPLVEIDDGCWNVPELISVLERVLPEHAEIRDLALRIQLGARGRRDLLLGARQVVGEGRRDKLIVLSFLDVTDREAARRQQDRHASELERSNRDLQDFAHAASHDLQEPLRKIRTYADQLARALDPATLDERTARYLERLPEAAVRLQTRIDDLLQLARVGRSRANRQQADLGAIVASVLDDLEVALTASDAQVDVGELPSLWADPAQMRLLFQNLVSNALKFRKPEAAPIVRIRSEPMKKPADGHRVIVEDEGIGFSQEHAEQIFGAFQRLHGRDEYEGSGVGLAICRRIVEHHGGSITAEGRPDHGARFLVTLPGLPSQQEHGS